MHFFLQSESVEVKTFSEIMAEKRRKRQLEKEQQQSKNSSSQEESGKEDKAKRKFRFQPILFGDEKTGQEFSDNNND